MYIHTNNLYIYIYTCIYYVYISPPPPIFPNDFMAKVAFYVTRNFKVPVCAAGVRSSSQALIAMGLGASSVILREPLAGCIEAPHGGQATLPLHHTQLGASKGETACMLFFWCFFG